MRLFPTVAVGLYLLTALYLGIPYRRKLGWWASAACTSCASTSSLTKRRCSAAYRKSGHREAERHQRKPVEDARDPFSIALVDKLGHELRRKRQKAHEQEHQEVQPVERRVGRAQCPRDRRVLQPRRRRS